MVERRPNAIGLVIMAVIYWGALFYWLRGDLLDGDAVEQTRALKMLLVSFPYVGYVMWAAMKDLPDNIREIPYLGKSLKGLIWLVFVLALARWGWVDKAAVGYLLVGVALLGLGAAMAMVCLLYSGTASSRLYGLERLVDVYPSITKPEGHVRFNQKMWTTTLVLIIYFMMTNVMIYGLSDSTLDIFSSFRAIMAGASGSIMHLGIGPIVTGSIIMQLFAGAKIIQLDLQDSSDKQLYQGVQKLLVLFMIPVESIQARASSGSTASAGPTPSSSRNCSSAPTSCSCSTNWSASGGLAVVSHCSSPPESHSRRSLEHCLRCQWSKALRWASTTRLREPCQ